MALPLGPVEFESALRLFDETTRALDARARRLDEVLTVKQAELQAANQRLAEQLAEVDRLSSWLNLLLSSVSSGVVATDCKGCITLVNPQAEAAFAGLRHDLVGASYSDLFPQSPLRAVLEACVACDFVHSVPGEHGMPRQLAGRISPIRDGSGALVGAVEVFNDVTELEKLRERAGRDERLRALGEMAAGVAHEIRNPLNGIEGFASLLARDLGGDSPHKRHVDAIVTGVRHLNQTVTGLLAYTRQRMPQMRPIPLRELAEDCLRHVGMEYPEQPELFTLEDHWGEACYSCDGTQIRQVLLNLLQNAAQAALALRAREARVVLRLHQVDQAGAEVVVDDNGPGVPGELRARLGTPFFTTKDQGTGLGLAISHHLIQLHGGQLHIEDAPPPLSGARFRVRI